jgi:Cro/C1-type HTH DNA-binding domain
VKIRSVRANNRTRSFEVETPKGMLTFPYAKVSPKPTATDRIARVYVDRELGREGFTYELASGLEGSLHVDAVLEEHEDPTFMVDLLVYNLTSEASRRMKTTHLSHREICRRLGTSAAQLYRLLDTGNDSTSLRQLLELLHVLGCRVELKMRDAAAKARPANALRSSGRAARK